MAASVVCTTVTRLWPQENASEAPPQQSIDALGAKAQQGEGFGSAAQQSSGFRGLGALGGSPAQPSVFTVKFCHVINAQMIMLAGSAIFDER